MARPLHYFLTREIEMTVPDPRSPPPDRGPPRWLVRTTTARWAFLVLAGALASILVFSAISTWATARAAHDTMVQGQAADLFHTVRRDVPHGPRAATEDALEAFVRDHREVGLRYVAVLDHRHERVAAAGTSIVDTERPPPPGRAFEHDGIIRMAAPSGPPGGPPPFGPPGGPPPSGPPDGDLGKHPPPPGKGPPPGERLIVIEFEPALGAQLQAHAQRSLAIGIAGAVGLLVVGGVFFALSRRAAVVEAQLAERRHLASLGEMSAVLAHELRNPLTSLRGHAQLLEEQLPEGRARDKAQRVVAETTRLQQLIDGLLDFAKSGSIVRTAVDPVALLRAAAADVADERIEIIADGAPATWMLDGPRVQQVLTNLLANAVQASEHGERVVASVALRGERLVFAVRDHGAGVPAEVRADLFDAFRTTRTRGVGLGLAVARRIVDLHGGTLGFTDGAPAGTVFEVELPAHD